MAKETNSKKESNEDEKRELIRQSNADNEPAQLNQENEARSINNIGSNRGKGAGSLHQVEANGAGQGLDPSATQKYIADHELKIKPWYQLLL